MGQNRGDERSHPLNAAGKKKPIGKGEVERKKARDRQRMKRVRDSDWEMELQWDVLTVAACHHTPQDFSLCMCVACVCVCVCGVIFEYALLAVTLSKDTCDLSLSRSLSLHRGAGNVIAA